MGAVVLDASVVLALLDPQDALHQAATRAVREHRAEGARFLLPASVLAEVLAGVARLGDEEPDQRRSQIVAAFGPPVALDEPVAVSAARLRASHRSLRLPDAIVLATAEVLDAQAVLTGDKRWGRLTGEAHILRHLSGGSAFGVRAEGTAQPPEGERGTRLVRPSMAS